MRKSIKLLFILFLCFFIFSPAQAEKIVDTGDYVGGAGGYALNTGQWLAAQFSLSQAYNITGLYGWIHPSNTGTMTIALYGDNFSDLPDTSNQYFAQQFSPSATDADWYGLSALNIPLIAGTYWISFEVREGDTNYGAMPVPFDDPLANSAYFNGSNWVAYDPADYGVNIFGEIQGTSVPEPATMLLLGFGLIGLSGFRRKFRKS